MNVFFTSDTHFHHANIIKYSNRPFKNTVDMNDALISNWNQKVGKNDLIYHLGDFSFGREDYLFDSVFNRLNGKIVFIQGNHDSLVRKNRNKFYNYHEGGHEIRIGGQDISLNHYAGLTWNKKHHGAWMLCGHTHYNCPVTRKDGTAIGKILDVGVDGHDFFPYSIKEIGEIMAKKPVQPENPLFKDHHEL